MKKLGFGLMRLPLTNPDDASSIDIKLFEKMVDVFIDKGFSYFDTAYVYHNGFSEKAAKAAIVKRYSRDKFLLADKMPLWNLEKHSDHEKIFNEQLDRCGVEYFDNYMLHNISLDSYQKASTLGSFDFILDKKQKGLIRKAGFSFHYNSELLEKVLNEYNEIDFVQLQINYLDWENDSIQSRKCYETAMKYGKEIIVMEPVKGGTLATVPTKAEEIFKNFSPALSVPSWAVRYAASLKGVSTVLSGMSDLNQINDNTSYMENFTPLNEKEYSIINEVKGIIMSNVAIQCTSCQYCVDFCHANIPIPKYFALFNNKKQVGELKFYVQDQYYKDYTKTYGKASDCTSCGSCQKHCPQMLKIPELMKDVAALFENT